MITGMEDNKILNLLIKTLEDKNFEINCEILDRETSNRLFYEINILEELINEVKSNKNWYL